MDRLRSLEAFVRVAECGSFAEAARQLRVARSVVTTRVQQLEEFVGAPLFHRTTRSVRLSELGELFFQDSVDLISRANDLVDHMRGLQSTPSGLLRVHALPGFVLGHLTTVLSGFNEQFPNITLDLVVNDAVVDPIRDGFDCALQIFPPVSEQLVERRLFPVRRVFCASPSYLDQHGRPEIPSNLPEHRLGLYSRYPSRDTWEFYGPEGKTSLSLRPTLHTNSVHLLRDYALADAALVCIPTLVAAEPVLDGRLEIVLSEFQLTSFWLSAVYAPTHRGTAKLRLFLQHLQSAFFGHLPDDVELIRRELIKDTVLE